MVFTHENEFCAMLAALNLEQVYDLAEDEKMGSQIRTHLQNCGARACRVIKKRVLDLQLERMPPEKRRVLEQQAREFADLFRKPGSSN